MEAAFWWKGFKMEISEQLHNEHKIFLSRIDEIIHKNYAKITGNDLAETYYDYFWKELKNHRSTSSGFTGWSEYLIFRLVYSIIEGDYGRKFSEPEEMNSGKMSQYFDFICEKCKERKKQATELKCFTSNEIIIANGMAVFVPFDEESDKPKQMEMSELKKKWIPKCPNPECKEPYKKFFPDISIWRFIGSRLELLAIIQVKLGEVDSNVMKHEMATFQRMNRKYEELKSLIIYYDLWGKEKRIENVKKRLKAEINKINGGSYIKWIILRGNNECLTKKLVEYLRLDRLNKK